MPFPTNSNLLYIFTAAKYFLLRPQSSSDYVLIFYHVLIVSSEAIGGATNPPLPSFSSIRYEFRGHRVTLMAPWDMSRLAPYSNLFPSLRNLKCISFKSQALPCRMHAYGDIVSRKSRRSTVSIVPRNPCFVHVHAFVFYLHENTVLKELHVLHENVA